MSATGHTKAILTSALLLLALTGCDQTPAGGRAGEPIAGAAAPRFLDTLPALVILDTLPEAEPRLLLPTGATVLSNGNIVVSDQWGATVRFFDPSGKLVRTVGRAGGGPGEFSFPTWLGQCGPNTVFVWDGGRGRMTVIDSAGTIVREYAPAEATDWRRCTRGGRFAVWGRPTQVARTESEMYTLPGTASLRFEDAEGDSVGGLGILPMGEPWILGKITQFAITDERVYIGTADSASLDVYDLEGDRLASIPLAIAPRAPTEANIERWLDALWETFNDTGYRQWGKEMTRRNSPVPEHVPLYTDLAVDPEGVIWVALSSPGDGETRFQVVSPDGTRLADFRIPTELRPYEVGQDYLLGRIHGPYDTPGVALYRVRRGPP